MPKIKTLNDLKRESGSVIKGNWALDERHRLTYQSEDADEAFELETSLVSVQSPRRVITGNRNLIEGFLVAAESNALIFSVTEKQKSGKRVTGLAKLTGNWQVNEHNQIEFEVERQASPGASKSPDSSSPKAKALGQSGKNDVLTFTGTWKLGKNHELIYGYRTRSLKSKTSKLHALTFKGYWDLTEKTRLTYLVEGDSDSAFRFRGTFQSPSILAKKGEIRYQLGVSGEGKGAKVKTIVLFGKWKLGQDFKFPAKTVPMQRLLGKLSNGLELSFEIEYPNGEKREIRFGAEYALTKDLSVAAKLIDRKGEPLGLEVLFTKDFLKLNAQAFVRLRKSLAENAIEAGITIPW